MQNLKIVKSAIEMTACFGKLSQAVPDKGKKD